MADTVPQWLRVASLCSMVCVATAAGLSAMSRPEATSELWVSAAQTPVHAAVSTKTHDFLRVPRNSGVLKRQYAKAYASQQPFDANDVIMMQPTGAESLPSTAHPVLGLVLIAMGSGILLWAMRSFQRGQRIPVDPLVMVAPSRTYAAFATTSEKSGFNNAAVASGNMHIGRRQMAPLVAGMAGLMMSKPASAAVPLDSALYSLLRVQEATQQENRLINSGLYKDVQRANVKLAVRMLVDNYKIADNFNAAASYLKDPVKKAQANQVGLAATDSLFTILEYFDTAYVDNLAVGEELYGNKRELVLGGLKSTSDKIDEFLAFFPKRDVQPVRDLIAEENRLNKEEYEKSYQSLPLNIAKP